MKKPLVGSLVAAFLVVGLCVGVLHAQKKAGTAKNSVIYTSGDKAEFKAMQGAPAGVSTAVIWGDPDKGPHGTWTKFAPGYDAGMHTHTNDVSIVVTKGAYLYKDDAGEKRVAAGEFLHVPGGHKHWSGGDKTEGAIFYEQGSGKFDLVAAK